MKKLRNLIREIIIESESEKKEFLGYHSSNRKMNDGFYKGSILNINDYEEIIRYAYIEIISDYDENLENEDIKAMNEVFKENGYGFTFVSDNPIESTSFQYSNYKYGDYLYKVYGNGNEILLTDPNEIGANIVVSKEPLYFEKYED